LYSINQSINHLEEAVALGAAARQLLLVRQQPVDERQLPRGSRLRRLRLLRQRRLQELAALVMPVRARCTKPKLT